MPTRRKFMYQGALAAMALVTSSPFTAMARDLCAVAGLSGDLPLTLLHTGTDGNDGEETALAVQRLKRTVRNVLLFHAGDATAAPAGYDALIPDGGPGSQPADAYRILHRQGRKIGILYAAAGATDVAARVTALSTWLKKEKHCHLVICLSRLGHRQPNGFDDLHLAGASSCIDVVLSGHGAPADAHPVTVANADGQEVIVVPAAGKAGRFGHLEIGFNPAGHKNFLAFHNLPAPSAACTA